MAVRQISVFLENRNGRLYNVASIFAEAGINILGLSVADTTDFGIIRFIVDQPDKAQAVCRDNDVVCHVSNVLALEVGREVGGLVKILGMLKSERFNVEYMYTLAQYEGDNPILILRFDNVEEAEKPIVQAGGKLLNESDLGMK